jgi:tRNA 5-methylaminomethyl-2-thiouridine biosynthesis bifunctional protein
VDDPRFAYSYRHPPSGEWAHPLHCGPLEDAARTYVDPGWERIGPRIQAAPGGPPGGSRGWQALVIGFGRGFETIELLRRLRRHAPTARMLAVGLEPHPEWLEPWPPRWRDLEAGEAPWWGHRAGEWREASRSVRLLPIRAAEALAASEPASWDWILLDLFSPAQAPLDWEEGLWPGLARGAAPGAILTSYTCARSVRNGLAEAGAAVEILRRPGHRDTLRAIWPASAQP